MTGAYGESLLAEETIEELSPGGLCIIQARQGYRYSLDPFLLADFVDVVSGGQVADLGAGSGLLPLLLAAKVGSGRIVGLEIQEAMVERARRTVDLNRLQGTISLVQGDVRRLPQELPRACHDLVVTNPPYRSPASGRISHGDERSAARHELNGGLADFVAAGRKLLKDGGRFAVIFPVERLVELLTGMREERLEPKRLRMVHSRRDDSASLVLAEGRKNGRGGLTVEPPLFVYEGEGRSYSAEMQKIRGTTVF
ncbi:MAG: methyltransferase [Desulfuromonas sp.]|nr:MAG: methyltransferase [Desulfuromonas sp.]